MVGKETVTRKGKAGPALGAMAKEAAAAASGARVYVCRADELPQDISFEFNARSPSKASRAYKSMRETLLEQPERFEQLNGGITLANGRYVLDGGHTIMAIMDAIKEDGVNPQRVHVHVRDLGELSDEEMGARSAALNRRVTPPLMGEKDLEGAWDSLKEALDEKYSHLYEFRPNTNPGARYKVDFLIALLHAWSDKKAEKAYSGKGQLVRLYSGSKYERVLPLLNTAIEFYSYVYKTLLKEKLVQKMESVRMDAETILPNGETVKGFLPESLVWPTFAAFEMLINDKGEIKRDLEKELGKKKPALVKSLLSDYKECGKNPAKYGKTSESYLNAKIALGRAESDD